MGVITGKKCTCDRCGETIFVETQYGKSIVPENWVWCKLLIETNVLLCTECYDEASRLVATFLTNRERKH